jgi:hypothetical protein
LDKTTSLKTTNLLIKICHTYFMLGSIHKTIKSMVICCDNNGLFVIRVSHRTTLALPAMLKDIANSKNLGLF